MFETQYEALRRQGISRRSFLQFCSLTAASLGLGSAGAQAEAGSPSAGDASGAEGEEK